MLASKQWKCDECGALYYFRSSAVECCQPTVSEMYVCDKCEDEHLTKESADECCMETVAPKEPSNAETRAELEARGQLRLIE